MFLAMVISGRSLSRKINLPLPSFPYRHRQDV
jgi:hypothetical protein